MPEIDIEKEIYDHEDSFRLLQPDPETAEHELIGEERTNAMMVFGMIQPSWFRFRWDKFWIHLAVFALKLANRKTFQASTKYVKKGGSIYWKQSACFSWYRPVLHRTRIRRSRVEPVEGTQDAHASD